MRPRTNARHGPTNLICNSRTACDPLRRQADLVARFEVAEFDLGVLLVLLREADKIILIVDLSTVTGHEEAHVREGAPFPVDHAVDHTGAGAIALGLPAERRKKAKNDCSTPSLPVSHD